MTTHETNEEQRISEDFYARHAERYAKVAHEFLQSVYVESSHDKLKTDLDLQHRLKQIIPGSRGLDAGCGAGARDVYAFYSEGYDIWGIDAIAENIDEARKWHPEIRDRVSVHNLKEPLPFEDATFDFTMCNAVIQHIDPEDVHDTVLPELARVLRPEGVLQLMFKDGSGIDTVYDKDYCTDRCFQLYPVEDIQQSLEKNGMQLMEPEEGELGGHMWFVDPKNSHHSVMFLKKK